jgi:type I restriction enzyme S subunit
MQVHGHKSEPDIIPDGWYNAKLESFLKIRMGQSPPSETYNNQRNGLPFFQGVTDFGEINPKGRIWCSEPRATANSNQILLSVRAPVGEINVTNVECCIGRGVAALESINSDLKYCFYLLKYFKSKFLKTSQGTTFEAINRNDIANVVIPFTNNVHEQQKIASNLSRVDELIEKTDQVIEQTQRLKKGLMQRLLTKGIGHQRYKSFRFGPLFLDYEIPDKWQVLTLKQCVRSDVPITYGMVQAGPHVPDGIPYIRTGDMSGGRLSKDNMLCTSEEIATSFRRSQVKAGEIVCALRGIVGMVLEVPEELEGANLTQGTARISPRHDIDRRYLLWALQSEYARRQFEVFSKGTTLDEITLEQLRTIKVAIPSDINEQISLAHILDQIKLAIDLRQKYKEKVLMLKAGLMQKLLTGKIRVKI